MELDVLIGLLEIVIAVLIFGSVYAPIKPFALKDGMSVQLFMNIGLLMGGFIVYASQSFPPFYPLCLLGGASWATANALAILIINDLGLGTASLLFSITNCTMNFLIGYFGLFGTLPRPPSNKWLLFSGLAFIITGGALISQVKNKTTLLKLEKNTTSTIHLQNSNENSKRNIWKSNKVASSISVVSEKQQQKIDIESSKISTKIYETSILMRIKHSIYIILSLITGLFFAVSSTPIIAMQDNRQYFGDVPANSLPYMFSYYFGAFLQASIIFTIYTIYKRNSPFINPKSAVPAIFSGFFCCMGMVLFYLATEILSQSISGPISAVLPACVAALWSLLYFKEIEPGKNQNLLFIAMTCSTLGSMAIGLSK